LIGEAWLEGINRKHLKTLHVKNKYLRWIFGVSEEGIQKEYIGQLDGVLDFRFLSNYQIHILPLQKRKFLSKKTRPAAAPELQ
jgi:hypothetical protein